MCELEKADVFRLEQGADGLGRGRVIGPFRCGEIRWLKGILETCEGPAQLAHLALLLAEFFLGGFEFGQKTAVVRTELLEAALGPEPFVPLSGQLRLWDNGVSTIDAACLLAGRNSLLGGCCLVMLMVGRVGAAACSPLCVCLERQDVFAAPDGTARKLCDWTGHSAAAVCYGDSSGIPAKEDCGFGRPQERLVRVWMTLLPGHYVASRETSLVVKYNIGYAYSCFRVGTRRALKGFCCFGRIVSFEAAAVIASGRGLAAIESARELEMNPGGPVTLRLSEFERLFHVSASRLETLREIGYLDEIGVRVYETLGSHRRVEIADVARARAGLPVLRVSEALKAIVDARPDWPASVRPQRRQFAWLVTRMGLGIRTKGSQRLLRPQDVEMLSREIDRILAEKGAGAASGA